MKAYDIFKSIEMINKLNLNIRGRDLYSITLLTTTGYKMIDLNDYDYFIKLIKQLYGDINIDNRTFTKGELSYSINILNDEIIYLYIDEV